MARGKSRSASALALITKSLNDGAGESPAAALSCLRSSTASSMSTSTVSTKSGAVAFDSAIRRATVCCRRVRSCCVASPRPVCLSPETTGAGTSFFGASSSAAGASALASAGAASSFAGASASAVAAPPLAAASTSAFTIRPPGPEPLSWPSSTPISRAIRFATGEALTRSPPPLPDGASDSARAGAGSGASSRLPLPELVLLGLLLGLSARLLGGGLLRGRVVLGRRLRAVAEPRDRLADRQRVALLRHDRERAVGVGLVGHVGLVRLDLDELFPALDLVPVGLQPLEDRALLHRVGQAGHRDIGHARHSTHFGRLTR